MNKEELKKILPHREPMLLVDEAELIDDGEKKKAVGKYTVKGDEWFLQGHFPGNPVVPGVILCEMMAQNCCVLLADRQPGAARSGAGCPPDEEREAAAAVSADGGTAGNDTADEKAVQEATPMYTGLTNVKFKNPVKPGDTITLECTIERVKEPFYFAKGKGTVNGKLSVSGEFSFALVK